MKIAILDREFTFSFRGFGPQYTYETITGKPFEYNSTYALHLLFYATLKFCNLDDFKMSFEEFSEWLYDNPEAEQAMATEIREETERRAARLDKKKKRVRGKPLSVRELYALIVGEAGIDPRYFLREMSPDEAADFIEGYRRRERQSWERARVGWMTQVAAEGKSATDIFPLPWDEKPKQKRVTKKQRDELRQKAAQMAEKIKQAKANGKR